MIRIDTPLVGTALVAIVLLSPHESQSYEIRSHRALNHQAARFSSIDSYLSQNLGLALGLDQHVIDRTVLDPSLSRWASSSRGRLNGSTRAGKQRKTAGSMTCRSLTTSLSRPSFRRCGGAIPRPRSRFYAPSVFLSKTIRFPGPRPSEVGAGFGPALPLTPSC